MSEGFQIAGKSAATWSSGIYRSPGITAALALTNLSLRPKNLQDCEVMLGWGLKNNTQKPFALARQAGIPPIHLEDGFLRSFRPGKFGDPALSFVVDDLGIYYDSTRPSRLEQLIQYAENKPEQSKRISGLITRFREQGLSKYNHALKPHDLPDTDRPRVLVVDQSPGDLSITHGLATASSFHDMLDAARDENPDAEILIKTHPDVIFSKGKGHFGKLKTDNRTRIISQAVSPKSLLDSVERTYVVTSQLGFEALLYGNTVRCFGMPWYSGWGLTQDEQQCERRNKTASLPDLFAAAYIQYTQYINPYSGKKGQIEDVMDWLEQQQSFANQRMGNTLCIGFRAWKKGHLHSFLGHPSGKLKVLRHGKNLSNDHLQDNHQVVIWGSTEYPSLERYCRSQDKPWLRMEDGFLRSVGLGSDFVRPASLVLDSEGIYYDPRQPSNLETLLNDGNFDNALLARANTLIKTLRSSGLSKYTLGVKDKMVMDAPDGKRRILVVGQVEDDASIRLGCPGIRTNLALLERVRAENPAAWLIYKPHPDVMAGNRKGKVSNQDVKRICDQYLPNVDIHSAIKWVNEVHVLTSLAGFEALILEKPVVTHGQPFYASWGLTDDRCPVSRRSRKISLSELVAASLILYPCYYDWEFRGFTTPEAIMAKLLLQREQAADSIGLGRLKRYRNKLSNLLEGLSNG